MKTRAVFFPFDLFGSAGTAAGAQLLADAVRELLDDNRREQMPTRARVYRDRLHVREFTFDTPDAYRDWRATGRRATRRVLQAGDFLLWVSGNHLGVLPVYDELAARPQPPLVVQFDAHLDVYNLSDCTDELSHGNFLLHCAGPLPPVVNVGHRELLLPPEHVGLYYKDVLSAADVTLDPDAAVARLRRLAAAAGSVWLDLDCDVLDPAYFPALAHPLPFGLSPPLLLRLLDAVWCDRVIGLSVSEFDPARDRHDRSLATLLWLVEYLLLRLYERPTSSG